jgi:transcriptional regulator with XRE-family HTH domain
MFFDNNFQMFDLKQFRKVNKLSQVNAAKYFNCDQSFISQIENNLRPIPDSYISAILADSNMIINDEIYKAENNTATCKLCEQKDKTIRALEIAIASLQENIEDQKSKISSLEKASVASNSNYSQTA